MARPRRSTPTHPSTNRVRDGVPTVPELLRALRLLQVPVDQEAIGLAAMSEERRRTTLLALLEAARE